MGLNFSKEKVCKSVPQDCYGRPCFNGDFVQLFDDRGENEFLATLTVDEYMNWQFDFDDKCKEFAKEFFQDYVDYGLPFSAFRDEYYPTWKFNQAQIVMFGKL